MGFTSSLSFFFICFMQLVEGSVLSSSLSSLWPTFAGLFACLDFGPCPLFPFLSLQGCFLSIKFGRVSSIRFAHVHRHFALELY
jgi:hypothetical protein